MSMKERAVLAEVATILGVAPPMEIMYLMQPRKRTEGQEHIRPIIQESCMKLSSSKWILSWQMPRFCSGACSTFRGNLPRYNFILGSLVKQQYFS